MPFTSFDLPANKCAIIKSTDGTFNDHSSQIMTSSAAYMAVGFNDAEIQQYKHKKITGGYLYMRLYPYSAAIAKSCKFIAETFEAPFNETTITYNNKPSIKTGLASSDYPSAAYQTWTRLSANLYIYSSYEYLQNAINNGIIAKLGGSSAECYNSQLATRYYSGYEPFLTVYINTDYDAVIEPYGCSPQSGYIDKTIDNTFSWSTKQEYLSYVPLTVSSITFKWRLGEGQSEHSVPLSASATSYTVPANTFTGSSVQWCISVTDNEGYTTTSEWYTLSTAEETSTASINSPKNTMIDGSIANTFSWNHHIGTGTAPTGADLQKSANGTTWTTLATVTGSDTTTTIAANTFTSGQWYWRVRTYNTDNVAGAWSDAVSFISVASPILQGVTATQTPRPTVSWQCSDQQGYQVKIGSYDSGVRFGTAQNFKYPGYLADGTYTVKVRVVNQYGLWSAWQTASCTVSNTAGTDITLLVAHSDAVANLSWSTTGTYSAFILYRNNVPIYKGTDTHYTDNLALNSVSYKVRGVTTGSDNYTLSNVVDAELTVDCMMIADINSFNWMRLEKSQSTECEINLSHKNSSRVEHISGAEYPVLEMSEYKDKILSGKAAFTDMTEAKAFSNLNGKCVVVKTPKGDMVVGLLSAVQEVQNTFFYGFSFSVQHTFLLEEVDI